MIAARDSAAAQYDEAIAARGRTQARIKEIQRLLAALPRLTALRSAREKLAPLESLPEVPHGMAEELATLQLDEVELLTRAKGVAERLQELSSELEKETIDEVALGLLDRASRLPALQARYLTATKDIPERLLQMREADTAIAGILRRIGCEDEPNPERLILGASVVGALRELLESRSGIASSLRTAEMEVSDARRRVDEAREKLEAAGCATDVPANEDAGAAALASTLAALRTDDHRARLRLAEKSLASHCETLSARLRELKPWEGEPQHLLDMEVSDRFTIDRWKADLATARKHIERNEQEVQRLTTEREHLRAELEALEKITGVVTDNEAAEVRAARELAWAEHRRSLDTSSADSFEKALRQDDLTTNARFVHVNELAKLHQGLQAAAVMDVDLDRARRQLDSAKADLQRIEGEIADTVARMSLRLPARTTPDLLDAWLTARERALVAYAEVRSSEQDQKAAQEDGEAACERLKAALDAASVSYDPDASFERLMALAQAAGGRSADLKQLRREFADRQRDLMERERALERASAEDRNWRAEWTAACSNSWLANAGPPSVSEVREILSVIGDLGSFIEKKSGLADRVAKMEKDKAEFAAEVERLADELRIPAEQSSPLDLASAVENRVRLAASARDRRREREGTVEAAQEKQRGLVEAIAIHEQRKAKILRSFGVATLSEAGTVLQQLEKRAALRGEADSASADIINAIGSQTLRGAEEALENTDRTALEVELAELEARFEDQDQRSRELFTEHSKADDAVNAIGDDDAVARIEERRRTVALEIEEKALRHLKIRIGVAAAEQALRLYRDRHRSSMMARASEAFQAISRGAYKGLTTQPDKDTEMLVAVSADGASKVASALSKGTRFQLYLALRVAGYHEFAASHLAVPFLADDIMETFDDFRAQEAFCLFAQMAQVGQVIYFTHHQHLCDIARKVCPSARIHELPQAPPLHLVETRQNVA